jgi:hypothetical protein
LVNTFLKMSQNQPKNPIPKLNPSLFHQKQSLVEERNFQRWLACLHGVSISCFSNSSNGIYEIFCRTFLLELIHQLQTQYQVVKFVHLMAWDSTCSIILMQWYVIHQIIIVLNLILPKWNK